MQNNLVLIHQLAHSGVSEFCFEFEARFFIDIGEWGIVLSKWVSDVNIESTSQRRDLRLECVDIVLDRRVGHSTRARFFKAF